MLSLFDILGLSATFTLDEKALEKSYFEAQREFHPDKSIDKDEKERNDAALRSQMINEAYDTLKNPLTRAEHLLQLKGYEVNAEENNAVSSPLLMEMMELRERIHGNTGDGRALLATVEEVKAIAKQCVGDIEAAFATDDLASAVTETTRLSYLTKALEDAYMLLYRFKSREKQE